MRIVVGRPPLFEEIRAAFPLASSPSVIFAWGDVIYTSAGATVSPALRAHEAVHGVRQVSDVEGWWRRYIADAQFRLDEEIPAHIAEYKHFAAQPRNLRRLALHNIAHRLASPLYGRMIKYDDARRLLKAA